MVGSARYGCLDMCSSLLHCLLMATTAPRRIDKHLLALAESSGALFHRSGTEQLEHWATLGAAVETVLGLPTVAKFKTLVRAPNIDALIAQAGTPAANRRLARFLEKQAFPQYGADPENPGRMIMHAKGSRRSSKRRSNATLATKDADR
jgi:hypothetical protein